MTPEALRELDEDDLEVVHSILDRLSERQAGIFSMWAGLTDGRPKSLDQIRQVYGVGPRTVAAVVAKAESLLRRQLGLQS